MTQEIKVGSIVTLRGRVISVYPDGRSRVMLDGENWSNWFPRSAFLTVENPPEPLRVGDLVRERGSSEMGLLKAVDAQVGWIAFSPNFHLTIPLSDLERAASS